MVLGTDACCQSNAWSPREPDILGVLLDLDVSQFPFAELRVWFARVVGLG